ncbi:MAG: ABC transporter ATP-binding protein, partial [Verrucomicrobia bacterium]|nr:ABC transporter ATP-binding protein [Verrucomicrobiota bacterium]
PISAVVIAEEIVRLNQRIGVTSLVVTHERELAFGIADRIAVLTSGAIVAIGTPAEIRRSTVPEVTGFLSADFNLVTQKEIV